MAALQKGEVVTGMTGVHITYEPDRIRVFKPIHELHLQPGDIILRYMYRAEKALPTSGQTVSGKGNMIAASSRKRTIQAV
ncbi:MAG TPA: hypothetical protein VJN92_17880 [Candidatus Acidoferrum sp.]|nr:hypothetical protein [Candidatus Acidoferrum sp.]